jgi:2-aminophenol/2-amino-5-chlorophenol 1,6-dioxygenase subunit alpha
MPEGRIVKGYIMPGLPHVMLPRDSASRLELRNACRVAGANVREARPDVLVIFSTQWVSVLGHLVQARPNPIGLHVDENWYDLGNLPYNFRTDLDLARKTIDLGTAAGLQVRSVDYEGFPVDTGTLVALDFLNPKNEIPVVCISCNIYSGRDEELKLGRAAADAVRALGRRAVMVASTGLSGHYFTREITDEEDRIVNDADDAANRRLLDLMASGKCIDAMDLVPEYAAATGADMQFKSYYWLMGAIGSGRIDGLDKVSDKVSDKVTGKVLGYGSIWGSGAAVVEFTV